MAKPAKKRKRKRSTSAGPPPAAPSSQPLLPAPSPTPSSPTSPDSVPDAPAFFSHEWETLPPAPPATDSKKVMSWAEQHQLFPGQAPPLVPSFSWMHDERRVTLAGHLLRRQDEDPGRYTTYLPGTGRPRVNPKRRQGRPRTAWAEWTHKLAWYKVRGILGAPWCQQDPDPASPEQQGLLNFLALAREF